MPLPPFPFDNSYARLPEDFFEHSVPTPVTSPELIDFNAPLAEELGIDTSNADEAELASVFSGNRVPEGAEPIALAYAGHQFGNFVPQLGDGRAILLGEVIDQTHKRRDIQLKGAGRTPFSRGGDGRAPLGPVVREYLLSEAMHALGVPTSRALAAVGTGETVLRNRSEPGAILTRVAASHIRVGTFQFFAVRQKTDNVQQLADYAISRHYPAVMFTDTPYLELLRVVVLKQAELIAQWMSVGFIHGVMNTDNVAISGETLDYGPCAFMDTYHPDTVFSSIDMMGRYAYGNQPDIGYWNLARFAESLLPLIDDDKQRAVEKAKTVLAEFSSHYEAEWVRLMGAKIGLDSPAQSDRGLIQDLLALMATNELDFTRFFRELSHLAANPDDDTRVTTLLQTQEDWNSWLQRWLARLEQEPESPEERSSRMLRTNPAIIPRNHLVERVIQQMESGNTTLFHELLDQFRDPFPTTLDGSAHTQPPSESERVQRTFCGT